MKTFFNKIIFGLFLLFFTFNSKGQEIEHFNYNISLNSGISSYETLPFWLVSNRYGSVPNSNFGALNASIFSNLKKPTKNFGIAYKASATGFIANENTTTGYIADKNSVFINELYVRLQYKNWALDLGNRNGEIKWEGLSSSNGNIVKSINARAYPGFNIKTLEYLKLPFAKNWLSFQLNFANYWLNDERSVDKANLHHSSLFFKFKLNPKFELIAGIDHYAQWGGTSDIAGEQPDSFKDFIRIVLGKSGGSNSSESDQLNALGNHLGAYLFQMNYSGDHTHINFYYSHPFEDGSGMELQNWMDGLYGLMIDLKQPEAPISHILTEFTYTKNMSGANPPDQGYDENGNKIHGRGLDNYFNNGVYTSGWTYFGHTIGSPYFTTKPVDENGITQGVIIGDNRFMAFNVGIKGTFKPITYKAMLSHVTYFGWFNNEYDSKPKQFSGLLEINLPEKSNRVPFNISASVSFDTGTYAPVNFGGFITLSKNGFF
ncbi:Capsule assembly protein Wzi [Lutibacter agarilyticus]|uniref:Capsule assembly protein Wzi n=1 Tax=Lutibacter agarilyticus TaxID=1109740 RepID=A0A238V7L5_9FLAO|nr:capsule assembly Wzi family protein [Lutibacter agarilyticus]SNR30027.1 Capsule assembly protein Wzi [Lutibacter agarilyticus]